MCGTEDVWQLPIYGMEVLAVANNLSCSVLIGCTADAAVYLCDELHIFDLSASSIRHECIDRDYSAFHGSFVPPKASLSRK